MNLREFANPPKQYRPLPIWTLNGEIEPTEIEMQARELKKKGFGGYILHAGEGLKTTYLDDDWMKALKKALDVAGELKIEAWLHDEDREPSGYGGGTLTADNDELLARALVWTEDIAALDEKGRNSILAYTKKNGDGTDALYKEPPDDTSDAGAFFVRISRRGHPWFNGENYVDLLNPDAVKAIIEKVYDVYFRMFKSSFGNYLPGIVTGGATVNRTINRYPGDRYHPVSLPWSDRLPGHFEKLHGYSLIDNLHHLISSKPEGFRIRHDFWRAVNDLFIDTFTFPLSSWCSDQNLTFAGAISRADGFRSMILSGGSVMPHWEHMGVPTIESPGRTVDNPAGVKEAVSVAAQFGKKRMVANIFGGAGHGRSFTELKAIIDRHIALGVTALSPRQIASSSTGDRKYDSPPTLSYHHPAWEQMKVLNDYMGRCAWTASRGRDNAGVLVMMPASGAYGAFDILDEDGGEELAAIERSYRALVDELIASHIPFHIGDERLTGRYGTAEDSVLRIGYGDYSAVILPPSPSWRKPVVDLLESFTGQLIIMGDVPRLVDGRESDRLTKLADRDGTAILPDEPPKVVDTVVEQFGRPVSVTGPDGLEERRVMVNHRIDAGAHLVFLANTADDVKIEITLTISAVGGVVELDPATGHGYRYAASYRDGQTLIETTLSPTGSRIFLIDPTQTSIDTKPAETREKSLTIEGPYTYSTGKLNNLVLDRCTLAMDNETILTAAPLWKVKEEIWKKTGLEEFFGYQPWILKKKNIRTRTNRTELTFRFVLRDMPDSLSLAMEQADRFTVTLNGKSIESSSGRMFIDRQTRVLNLKEHAIEGENVITAVTDYLWDTEIAPVYIIGDFAVGTEADGFPIMKKPETLATGSWTEQGFPFFTGPIIYLLRFPLTKDDRTRYELDLSGMRGALCTVSVNDTDVGAIPFPPYRGDITGALKDGDNLVRISVTGTLRNTFGPLHHAGGDDITLTNRETFRDEDSWVETYQLIPCGLLKPPRLIRITGGSVDIPELPEKSKEKPSEEPPAASPEPEPPAAKQDTEKTEFLPGFS